MDSVPASCRAWRQVHKLNIKTLTMHDEALIAYLAAKGDPVFYVLCAGCGERLCSLQASCNNEEPFKYYCTNCAGE